MTNISNEVEKGDLHISNLKGVYIWKLIKKSLFSLESLLSMVSIDLIWGYVILAVSNREEKEQIGQTISLEWGLWTNYVLTLALKKWNTNSI